jgi:hypothetical protein
MRGWTVGLIGAALLVVAVGAAVVAALTSSDDGTSIVELAVGDCFDLPDDASDADQLRSVDVVDCTTPHHAEVVSDGVLNADDAPYPDGDDELFDMVERACRAAGVVESDAFGLLPIAPTPELWASFDGRFLCVAIPFGGAAVTGSLVAG